MPLVYIDEEGLTPYAAPETKRRVLELVSQQYRDRTGLGGNSSYDGLDGIASEEPSSQRLRTLASLIEGAGVQVVTGPLGRAWWGIASREVQVTVWPDNYDWKDRHDSPEQWALEQVGAGALYNSHVRKGKAPSVRHRLYGAYMSAQALLQSLSDCTRDVPQLVHEDVPFTVVGVEEGIQLLEKHDGPLALDWEWHREHKHSVGLAISGGAAGDNTYVPVRAADVNRSDAQAALRLAFANFLRSGGQGVLHGGRADMGTQLDCDPIDLLKEGKYIADDTMVMAYLLGETALGLKPLSRKFLGRDPIENDREWEDESARFTGRYAAAGDTRNTFDLYRELRSRLADRPAQIKVYEDIERPLVPVIASMEKYGTPVSIPAVLRAYRDHVLIETGLCRAVRENYGRDLSDDADTRRFIQDCGFADPGTLDQRVISLNPHWCIDLILEYRRVRTRRRNFLKRVLQRWVGAGKPEDFSVYPRFNQAGSMDEGGPAAPRTGRLSSADPNLMNQPRDIRDIYVPPPGHKWWSYDYSGLELRLAAAMSGDPVMLAAFQEKRDLHGEFRNFITAKTGRDVGRVPAKTGNFEQLYEGGANQLVRILAKQRAFISVADAIAIVESHHTLFKRYHDWGAEQVQLAHERGYAETFYGRRRYIPEFNSDDAAAIAHGERAAQNHPIQGTGADIVKQAMVILARDVLPKYNAHLCIQVHDELDGWVPADADLESFDRDVRAVMESFVINGLPLIVEGAIGDSWAEAH